METFSRQVGDVLRRTRQDLGLTLHDVERLSRGSFKPSTIAGYERGERMISLERFRALAELYRVPAERLLVDALEDPQADKGVPIVIEIDRIGRIPEPERLIIAEHVHGIRTRRGDFLSPVVSLRSRDLETIALSAGLGARSLLTRLRPALASGRGRRPSRPRGKFPTSIGSSRALRSGGI
jgi:transcriptional regulator with XRE-family HTH domain